MSQYILSDIEIDYLKGEDESTYSDRKLEKKIRNKRQLLFPRLQKLIDDITLLYEAGYLDEDGAQSDWDQIYELTYSPNTAVERRTLRRNPDPDVKKTVQDITDIKTLDEFGHLFGSLVHMLVSTSPDEQPWEKILHGIIMFYLTVPDGSPSHRVPTLIKSLNFAAVEQWADDEDRNNESRSWNSYDTKFRYHTRDVDTLTSVDSLIEDIIKEESYIEINSTIVEKLRTNTGFVYNNENTLDIPKYTSAVESELSSLIEDTLLPHVDRIHKAVQRDIAILNKEWRGPDRDDIVLYTYQMERPSTSNNIASQFDKGVATNFVTTGIKRMSEEIEGSDLRTEYPLFRRGEQQWDLTPYGKLCAIYLDDRGPIKESLYRYGIKCGDFDNKYRDLISNVIKQIENTDKKPPK